MTETELLKKISECCDRMSPNELIRHLLEYESVVQHGGTYEFKTRNKDGSYEVLFTITKNNNEQHNDG
jgi:hypothetical protein